MLTPLVASSVQPAIIKSSERYKWKRSWKSRNGIYRKKFLVPLHSLHDIEITNYFNNELRYNGVFSRNILPRTKDGVHVLNLDHKNSKGTH